MNEVNVVVLLQITWLHKNIYQFQVERGMSFDTTCISNINYKDNNFQNAFLFWISSGGIQLSPAGKWGPSDHAQFTVSVFQEVKNCSGCPNNTFCCNEGVSCKDEPSPHNYDNLENNISSVLGTVRLARCIPISLLCNEHPNCGRICNADESPLTCGAVGFLSGPLRIFFIAGIIATLTLSNYLLLA
ncbi:unnamed protein product [Allacma fusca]|uniref:Uncharacterized protein n=1 Tax=Allacma fusca TaxID=39272 RepID=A0A8J2JAH2_9HEXA|nr:unnamed protein product [Allacma fusca]